MTGRSAFVAAGIAAVVLCLSSLSAGSAQPVQPVGAGSDWVAHGAADDETGYSRLDQINVGNVARLGLAWRLDLDDERTLQATPVAVGGTLYFTGGYSAVYAVDAVTGKLLWKHDPEVWKHAPIRMRYTLPANRGAAYADGQLFVATLDARLIALDAKTGKLLWSVETVPADSKYTSTGAPRTFNGKVIIGNSGGDFGSRGYVTAYDQKTGRQVWRFYTVPGSPEQNRGDPTMERAAATWTGEYWKTGTGGTVWNGITFDPELNRVYLGVGNSGPYDPAVRSPGGGDNLYLVSIVALDADTGNYVWHYQMNPREAWDYKSTSNMISTTLPIDGRPRKVLLQANVNGFFYVLDRETGKLLSAEKFGKVTWADRIDLKTGRPVERPNIRYETGETILWPSPFGAHNWQAMSFSPKTGLAYIPYMHVGMRITQAKPGTLFQARPGVLSIGNLGKSFIDRDPEDATGALIAWDPVAQKPRWKVDHPLMWNGGTLATAGGLVFQGTADGYFSGYDASTGKRLWRFNASLGIIAAPMSYSAGGRQYVSALVGYGGTNIIGGKVMNVGWKYGAQPRRLLTFALGGRAVLPPSDPPSFAVAAVDDPSIVINPADVEPGRMLFSLNCAACHGLDAVSAGAPGPDLRESQIAMQPDALWDVVHEGTLLQRGMPRFDRLDKAQVGQIHAFIRAMARDALKAGKNTKAATAAGQERL